MRVEDNSRVPQLLKDLTDLKKAKLEIGVFGSDDSHILMIARVHEYGVDIEVTEAMRGWFAANGYPLKQETDEIHIPERSFMRSTFDEEEQDWTRFVERRLEKVIKGNLRARELLNQVGAQMASDVQQKLIDLDDPQNSNMTVQRKGSSNPLIDSGGNGGLLSKITWKLVGI